MIQQQMLVEYFLYFIVAKSFKGTEGMYWCKQALDWNIWPFKNSWV